MRRLGDRIYARLHAAGIASVWTYDPALQDICGDLVRKNGKAGGDAPPTQMRKLAAAMSRCPDLFEVRIGMVQSLGGREARTRNFRLKPAPKDSPQ